LPPKPKKIASIVRRFLLILSLYGVLTTVLLSIYILTIAQVRQHLGQVDAIVVLGCATQNGQVSGMLQERLNEAILLYQAGYAPYILVSGGVGVGNALSESAVMRAYLIEMGIPRDKILVENRSLRTWENLAFSKQVLAQNNLSSILIVTSSFHLARALFTANRMGFEQIHFSGAQSNAHDFQFFFNYLREVFALLYYIVASGYLHFNPATRARSQEVFYIPQVIARLDYNP
jgi:uncharacterized SAM-binding protein YcdF (DUF218 family)